MPRRRRTRFRRVEWAPPSLPGLRPFRPRFGRFLPTDKPQVAGLGVDGDSVRHGRAQFAIP